MTKPVTVDDLSRAELLRFIKGRFIIYDEADLIYAQWREANAEWKRLSTEAEKLREPLQELAAAADAARGTPNLGAALRAYDDARKPADAAEDKVERAWRRGQKLYERLEAVSVTRR